MTCISHSKIEQVFQDFPEIQLVILFGSALSGRLTYRSDIDIAFAAQKKVSQEQRYELYISLERSLGRHIDLIDLHCVNGHILKNILCTGEVVIKKSVPLLAFFLKKMWYNQADMMPLTKMILEKQVADFIKVQ